MSMSSRMCLSSLLAVFAIVAGLATAAQASVHPLTGNLRFQFGDGLPIPITFQPAPNGAILPIPGATISQPPGVDPQQRDIVFNGGEFFYPPNTAVLAALGLNPVIYQIKTSISVTYPTSPLGGTLRFSPGGRSGAATVQYCDGNGPVTGTNNPACASGMDGGTSLPGRLIYTSLGNQFGGALTARIGGGVDIAFTGGGTANPPCSGSQCKIIMALADPNSTGTGAPGNAFGGGGTSPGTAVASGAFTGTITAMGAVVGVGAAFGPGIANPATSAGGPWTTGRLTVSQTAALAAAEVFTLTGSDQRTFGGAGTISLVAGGVSQRATSGPNGNRGWMNLTLGASLGALPSISGPGIAALVGLMSLAGSYAMRQRNRK